MDPLAPLAATIPLAMAAVIAGIGAFAPRRVYEWMAVATAVVVTGICAALLVQSSHQPIVYWFGGWRPLPGGIALGISFSIDPFGAGMACLASSLTLAALLFSWRYFETVGSLFHALMVAYMGAMVAFFLTGDLFDLFVFFELSGVAAFILAGYRVEEQAPLQGAYNFGVTNTVAAFMILLGMALVYGRTGALNLAQIGKALAGHPIDSLVVVSFVLLMCGYFVKGAIVPFHFWLADAHAVAPTPVCVLFSGVMVEMGLYAVARLWWTAYGSSLALHAEPIREILVVAGVLTALVGGVLAFYQHHLKRMLAYTTAGHAGLFLVGIALMTGNSLAGAAVYVVGHAGVKGSLFLCVGILAHRSGSFDEVRLRGAGRDMPLLGAVYLVGGLALAALPPFGPYLGSALIQGDAGVPGYPWIPAVFIVVEILIGAAVLRTAATVFGGWGRAETGFYSPRLGDEVEAETGRGYRVPATMLVPAVGLLAAGLALGLVPGLAATAERAAVGFRDTGAYTAAVLGIGPWRAPELARQTLPGATDLAHGLGSAAGAVLLAVLAAFRHRLPRPVLAGPLAGLLDGLRRVHSGVVNDYVTWALAGFAVFGAAFALALR